MAKKIKFSIAQKQALKKLTYKWECSYRLGLRRGTLDSLVDKGLVERKYNQGYMFSPAVNIEYRLN